MLNCPYNNICIKYQCDLACKEYSEFMHWSNRCNLGLNSPAITADLNKIYEADQVIQRATKDMTTFGSNFMHIGVYKGDNTQYMADLVTYVAICRYCKNIGFYNGVYRLNFAKYIEEIKKTWNTRYVDESLEDIKLWIESSKYLIIYNLGLVKFKDFESQTLLSIFQERYASDKYTMLILEKGNMSLPGDRTSTFYMKLRKEISLRGDSS